MKNCFLYLFLLLGISFKAKAQQLPYKNPGLPIETRVKDLLSRMTIEEKFWQLFMIPGDLEKGKEAQYRHGIFGLQVSAASTNGDAAQQMLSYNTGEDALSLAKKINAIQHYFVDQSRLGIPVIAFDEGLHGLVRGGATVFPQSIALAATFDTVLMHEVAAAIAVESKTRGIRDILSPVINIASDVRWGRVEETYGEDPFLTSAMGVAFVKAFEERNIITTPKHFIANVGDGGRDSYPIHWSERQLLSIYFPPFEAVIKRGGARSIMTAYNSLDGVPCTANEWLLTKTLKKKWGFNGFVISDAGAVGGSNVLHMTAKDYPESSQQAINAGLDVIFQTSYEHYRLFIPPFLDGRISMQRINDAVSRVLRAKFELGLFEHPYVDETEAAKWINNTSHQDIARHAAIESFVLLKNEKNVLPIASSIQSIAVIGVDAVEARLGGYSGPGSGKKNILDAITRRAGTAVKVSYSPGCGRLDEDWQTVPAEWLDHSDKNQSAPGLQGTYFNNINLAGEPVLTRNDAAVNFLWTISSPAPAVNNNFYSVRWTGRIRSPQSGLFKIGLSGNDGFRLYIDNQLLIDNWKKQTYSTILEDFYFDKDKSYSIRVEFFEPIGNAHLQLIWNVGKTDDRETRMSEAVQATQKSDMAIVVAGIEEGEFRDRAMLNLPGHQEELIQRIAAAGKPVVVLLVGGSAITMKNWLEKVDGVMDIWYPGQEGGDAVAAVLFGDENPGGRLPVTFPIDVAQAPLVYNHEPTGRGDDYNNLSGLPLFPFGFGLSYTHFSYDSIRLDKNKIHSKEPSIVKFLVKNDGAVAGDEVVQLYIKDVLSSVSRPVIELKGFQRIHLSPGQTESLSFIITPSMLSMLDEKLNRVVEPGDFQIMVGASSRDIRLKAMLTVIGK